MFAGIPNRIMGRFDTLSKEDKEYITNTWLNPDVPQSYRQFKDRMDERSIDIDVAYAYKKHEQFKRGALIMGICVGFMGFIGGVFYNAISELREYTPRVEHRATQEPGSTIDTIASQTEITNK